MVWESPLRFPSWIPVSPALEYYPAILIHISQHSMLRILLPTLLSQPNRYGATQEQMSRGCEGIGGNSLSINSTAPLLRARSNTLCWRAAWMAPFRIVWAIPVGAVQHWSQQQLVPCVATQPIGCAHGAYLQSRRTAARLDGGMRPDVLACPDSTEARTAEWCYYVAWVAGWHRAAA